MDVLIDQPLQTPRTKNTDNNKKDDVANSARSDVAMDTGADDDDCGGDDEGAVAELRRLVPTVGEDTVKTLLADDRILSALTDMSPSNASEAVRRLGEAVRNRPAGLDPIADPSGYFLKILRRYRRKSRGGGEGEVVRRLRELGDVVGEDVVERVLGHERVRSTLSSLTRSDGLEAVESFGKSVGSRSADLDPIADPSGYFLKILGRYEASDGRKRPRATSHHARHESEDDHDDDDDDDRSEGDRSLQSQLRLANRRVGRYRTNYWRAERTISKLEAKVQQLTGELNRAKRELRELKG